MSLSNSIKPVVGLAFSMTAIAVHALESPATPLPTPSAPKQLRDPFTPSQLMYDTAGAQGGAAAGAYGFLPNQETMKVPNLKLRGLLNPSGKAFIALLEVSGVGTFMVREGDEFNFDPSQPKNAIRVSKITRLSVTVETGTLGSIRVLR
ncbi:hypothetical protein [Methylomonas methanica]|nr:hypothetical protein [Methylomonas methanica]